MKILIDFFKNILSNVGFRPRLKLEPGAHALATWNELNRRKNTRIKYSHIGPVGDLPRVFYMDDEMGVGNISVGGMLILDDMDRLGGEVGTIVNIQLAWPEHSSSIRARIVGAQFARRHIQFIDFQPDTFQRLSRMIAAGFLGSKCHRVLDHGQIMDASEFWVGPTGESLHFPRKTTEIEFARITLHGRTLIIPHKSRPYFEDRGEVIDRDTLSQVLVLLANLPEASERVKNLIEHLQDHFKANPKRGASKHEVA